MRTKYLALSLLLSLVACGGDDGGASVVDGGRFDGGAALDATTNDAEVPPDAPNVVDAGLSVDAGTDAGTDAGPPCVCPPLPATCAEPSELEHGPSEDFRAQLLQVIACADERLDLAVYLSTWDCLADALEERLDAAPTLQVRMVVDDDLCPNVGGVRDCALGALADHPRVSFGDDGRSALMHHKYAIADGELAWVSSANFTFSSFCEDSNVSVVTRDPAIVGGLEAELARILGGTAGPIPRTPIEGEGQTLYLSPESPTTMPPAWFRALEQAFTDATTSIDVIIYAFTRTELSSALIAAHERGVRVRVLTSFRFRAEAPIAALREAGIEVRADDVHQKTAVIDGATLALGSANWSMNAWESNENSLWIEDAELAAATAAELDRLWSTATVVTE